MVNFKKRFVDLEIGWPGSVGDSHIFKTSCLNLMHIDWLSQISTAKLVTGEYDNGEVMYEDIPAFILADSAYFKVTETSDIVINALNKKLGGARYHVENAFGILKGRFRIFSLPLEHSVQDVRLVILLISAIFVLHNFLIDVQDTTEDWDDMRELEGNNIPKDNDQLEDDIAQDVGDTTTRKALIRHMKWKLES